MLPSERVDELEAELLEGLAELHRANERNARLRARIAELEAELNAKHAKLVDVADKLSENERLQERIEAAEMQLAHALENTERTAADERADVVAWLRENRWFGLVDDIDRGDHVGAAARAKEGR